jgi:hypothetical protein
MDVSVSWRSASRRRNWVVSPSTGCLTGAFDGGTRGAGGGITGTTLASAGAEIVFFRLAGAGLRFCFFAAMNAAKVKPLRRGGKLISL